MSKDPRKAATLGEASQNADGTFNGLAALSWLSEVLNPGRGVPLDEVRAIADRVIAEKRAKTNPEPAAPGNPTENPTP